jgi:hypothetical protein
MTHEAPSFLFADISGPFLVTELDGAGWKGPFTCWFV